MLTQKLATMMTLLGAPLLLGADGCGEVEVVVGCPEGTCTASPRAIAICDAEDKIAVCRGNLLGNQCNPEANQACWPCVQCDYVVCVAPACEEVGSDAGAANAAAEALMACAPDGGT